jgi:hypothetical protein
MSSKLWVKLFFLAIVFPWGPHQARAEIRLGISAPLNGDLGLALPSLGTDVFDSTAEIRRAGHAMDGALFTVMDTPADFRTEYRAAIKNIDQLSYAYNAFPLPAGRLKPGLTLRINTWLSDSIVSSYGPCQFSHGI